MGARQRGRSPLEGYAKNNAAAREAPGRGSPAINRLQHAGGQAAAFLMFKPPARSGLQAPILQRQLNIVSVG